MGLNTKYAHDSGANALQRLCTNSHLIWSCESITGIETGFADRKKKISSSCALGLPATWVWRKRKWRRLRFVTDP